MDPFEELLARSEPPVPELARRLRRLVLEVLPPSTVETVEGGDAGYGTGSGYTGWCA